MNKKIISFAIASIIATGVSAEYILKQIVNKGITFNTDSLQSNFTSHTFTNCGITAYYGPTLEECKTAYNNDWSGDISKFNINTQGIQEWTVPSTGNYRINVLGASGGYHYHAGHLPGRGISLSGDIELSEGTVLKIVVGSKGGKYGWTGGGGGASFIQIKGDVNPLIVAGGGGGAGNSGDAGCDATAANLPLSCNVGYTTRLANGGGQTDSNGGWGTGGAGWNSGGYGAPSAGTHSDWAGADLPTALKTTALGATATHGEGYINSYHDYNSPSCFGAPGGFGGGGSGQCNGAGAGGGYSGGSAGGSGGGSYYDDSRITNYSHTIGSYGNNGSVTIEKL